MEYPASFLLFYDIVVISISCCSAIVIKCLVWLCIDAVKGLNTQMFSGGNEFVFPTIARDLPGKSLMFSLLTLLSC